MADTKNPPKSGQQPAKPTARIDATHMGAASMRDDKPPPVDEDWGVDASDRVEVEEDVEGAEEREIDRTTSPRGGEEQTQTRRTTVTATEPETASNGMNADDYFGMLERLEAFKQNAIASVQEDQKRLDEEKAKFLAQYDQDTQANKEKLKKLGVEAQGGNQDDNAPQPRRRGRRRRVSANGETGGSTAASSTNTTATSGRRTRQKNDKTLKEAIVEVLSKKGRIDLKTIAEEIINSGFKTNSKKFGNTVRVQLYRLDDDGEVVQYDDNTFGLKKK